MDDQKLVQERIDLEKKLRRKGQKEFTTEMIKAFEENDIQGLEFKLKSISEHKQAVISQQSSDDDLAKAKRVVSNLVAPYNDQKKACDEKSRFVGLLIQEINGFQGYADEEEDEG